MEYKKVYNLTTLTNNKLLKRNVTIQIIKPTLLGTLLIISEPAFLTLLTKVAPNPFLYTKNKNILDNIKIIPD